MSPKITAPDAGETFFFSYWILLPVLILVIILILVFLPGLQDTIQNPQPVPTLIPYVPAAGWENMTP
jgi:hypothetical protein